MKVLSPILLLLGTLLYFVPDNNIEIELKPYFNKYLSLVEIYCSRDQLNLDRMSGIYFVNDFDNPNIIGLCTMSEFDWKIEIKYSYWESSDLDSKVQLIYHELSHCVLGLDHVNDPKNYMYFKDEGISVNDTTSQLLEDAWNYCGSR